MRLRVPKLRMPPPPLVAAVAEFPEMVEFEMVAVLLLKIPPPLSAVFPEMVELETVRVPPPTLKMPPPPSIPEVAVLPEMVELLTVRLPVL